jgi:hypothetical protein
LPQPTCSPTRRWFEYDPIEALDFARTARPVWEAPVDVRDVLLDGIVQLNQWLDDAIRELSAEQMNYLPDGKTVSIGFNAWHILRTQDNIVNFVFQKKPPIWMEQGYVEQMGLPQVAQGTGMSLEDARAVRIADPDVLRAYSSAVGKDCASFVRGVPLQTLEEVQMVKPLGEMPKWRVVRQVVMTHGFMHLGEINALRGQLGLSFSI